MLYAGLILFYLALFLRLRPVTPNSGEPATSFSIIIPARNEEENIVSCLQSIYRQQYPAHLYEVWVIDDHSTDNTAALVKALQAQHPSLHLVRLADEVQGKLLNAYKKKAIEITIPKTNGEWIVTTDADCIAGEKWLTCFDGYIRQHHPALIAAPVAFEHQGSVPSLFQCLDFMSLQGITAAAVAAEKHSMCNGANLAYRKSAFLEVGGFTGIDNIASGDDMLLMHKIRKQHPKQLGYLFSPDAVVRTLPMADWSSFFQQRIRWASKAERYDDKSIIAVLALVYLFNLLLLSLAIAAFFSGTAAWLFLFSTSVKIIVELVFMLPVARFFRQQQLLWWFPLMQPLHIVYIVVAGWLGKFGSYRWKERKVT